jgi:hypothetical protein
MLKDGSSPVVFRSTIRVSDIITTLSIDASTKIWGISDRISWSLGKSRAIVAAFWCAIEGSIPLYQIYDEAALQKISFDDDGVDDRTCGLCSVENVQEYQGTDNTGSVPQTPRCSLQRLLTVSISQHQENVQTMHEPGIC